ncbi:hypothetical protein [Kribbella qitaiheensis]|uniref:hypothetical protein n=1 Tax=Kribbella qitaiheensis TaxID=1544730 RepID=UPI00162A4FFB|nr:hypothetical protein [Kribbella qitaiheensis]
MIIDLEAAISKLVQAGIIKQVFPGAVWAVGDADGTVLRGAVGVLDPDRSTNLQ